MCNLPREIASCGLHCGIASCGSPHGIALYGWYYCVGLHCVDCIVGSHRAVLWDCIVRIAPCNLHCADFILRIPSCSIVRIPSFIPLCGFLHADSIVRIALCGMHRGIASCGLDRGTALCGLHCIVRSHRAGIASLHCAERIVESD